MSKSSFSKRSKLYVPTIRKKNKNIKKFLKDVAKNYSLNVAFNFLLKIIHLFYKREVAAKKKSKKVTRIYPYMSHETYFVSISHLHKQNYSSS